MDYRELQFLLLLLLNSEIKGEETKRTENDSLSSGMICGAESF